MFYLKIGYENVIYFYVFIYCFGLLPAFNEIGLVFIKKKFIVLVFHDSDLFTFAY